jgi:hypothetical protein
MQEQVLKQLREHTLETLLKQANFENPFGVPDFVFEHIQGEHGVIFCYRTKAFYPWTMWRKVVLEGSLTR